MGRRERRRERRRDGGWGVCVWGVGGMSRRSIPVSDECDHFEQAAIDEVSPDGESRAETPYAFVTERVREGGRERERDISQQNFVKELKKKLVYKEKSSFTPFPLKLLLISTSKKSMLLLRFVGFFVCQQDYTNTSSPYGAY